MDILTPHVGSYIRNCTQKHRTKDSKKSMATVKIEREVEIENNSDVDERLGCMATNMYGAAEEEEMSKLFQNRIQIKKTK
ncbi:hypothetical protein KI387_011147, partial [Taxus chinensis]